MVSYTEIFVIIFFLLILTAVIVLIVLLFRRTLNPSPPPPPPPPNSNMTNICLCNFNTANITNVNDNGDDNSLITTILPNSNNISCDTVCQNFTQNTEIAPYCTYENGLSVIKFLSSDSYSVFTSQNNNSTLTPLCISVLDPVKNGCSPDSCACSSVIGQYMTLGVNNCDSTPFSFFDTDTTYYVYKAGTQITNGETLNIYSRVDTSNTRSVLSNTPPTSNLSPNPWVVTNNSVVLTSN